MIASCSLMPVDLITINEIRSMAGCDNATVNWSSNYDSNTGTKKRIEVTLINPDKIYLEDPEKTKELSEKIVAKFVDAPGDLGDNWRFVLILSRGDNKTTVEMDEEHVREILDKQTADF
ncbi:hypothetical protein [Dawidia soli]|uniref:Uncharacterized protein n=1 Tax=Dawidia soli TaxID=2782352 RepID=A0AAP2GJG8_9BACT|nr:hypothetical protein [Dawidia soli]MBT1689391.1 hypothetical protein [Dawidia soli]